MPVLNPFLRALFQSSVLGQALAPQNYVLLVPSTDSLINGRDRESGKHYVDIVEDEDFLGAHILRTNTPEGHGKDANLRDARGKAKTYTTVNNRSVIIKESVVYTNKGFKQVIQAQLTTDTLYHSPTNDGQQWLIVYISKPLTGTFEKVAITPAIIKTTRKLDDTHTSASGRAAQPAKKDIRSFNELLGNFPMIARQMQPGLERLLTEFGKELGKPLPPPPSLRSPTSSLEDGTQPADADAVHSNGSVKLPFNDAAYFDDEEDVMRRALETAVTAAIDLFQSVDKQQLSFLGATTDLTGPAVELLIEKYVVESVHSTLLFPRLCSFHRTADQHLDHRIRHMECIDVSQVGLAVDEDWNSKRELLARIDQAVGIFRRMNTAGSPHRMLAILLQTQKVLSEPSHTTLPDDEKIPSLTISADILVSLLLLVVIRSQVRHLQARLSYMQRFIYIDDVDSGEIGYALSTLEAVLTYLAVDSGGIRQASKQNQLLWNHVRAGEVKDIRAVFEGSSEPVVIDDPVEPIPLRPIRSRVTPPASILSFNSDVVTGEEGGLSHVFPFQNAEQSSPVKKKKHVHMDARSMSISSATGSPLSRTATVESTLSGMETDISIPSLAQTQDQNGNSIPMMAIESQQPASLRYLLSLGEHYSVDFVLNDTTSEGTTLLSAAIQTANMEMVCLVLDYLGDSIDEHTYRKYLSKADDRGRTAAHYIFNTPSLISKLGHLIPWRQKDKTEHTPLFAVCRTYDHAEYHAMVADALRAAQTAQGDECSLKAEYHIDDKGNTLLHIINDAMIMQKVLQQCDADPNAINDKKFTPLMLASKYGRTDMVRVFFGDPRVDLSLRESRGMTAVELAKDDEIRNRIDDLTLFSDASASIPDQNGRLTAIVRSFFVEDGSTRYIVKSGAPNTALSSTTYTITTSKRSIQDFTHLAKYMSLDHPASYMPTLNSSQFRSPFQLHSRPSRAVLHDLQVQLDHFLKILMTHPTFSTHEMLWEFFLVPDMQQDQLEERAKMKAEFLKEKIADDYDPLTIAADLDDVASVMVHSRDMLRKVSLNNRAVIRHGHTYSHAGADMAEALSLAAYAFESLAPPSTTLPRSHMDAFAKIATLTYSDPASLPLYTYINAITSSQSTIGAVTSALHRPHTLVTQIRSAQKQLERDRSSLVHNSTPRKGIMNIHLPGMEELRLKSMRESEKAIIHDEMEIEHKGRELRYTQEVVLGELAGWTTWREEHGRQEIKRLARMTVIRERERLRGMQRVLRKLRDAKEGIHH